MKSHPTTLWCGGASTISQDVQSMSLSLCTQSRCPHNRICSCQRKTSRGAYVAGIILSVTSPSLPCYLFVYVKANLYSTSGMASVYTSGITPTFYIPGAQLSLGLLVIPITVNRSCMRPPGRQRHSTSWCRVCRRAEN